MRYTNKQERLPSVNRSSPPPPFETYDTACSLIKLMVFWYRTKPFTDSVVNHYNKRSPLEIAGADLGHRSWVDLSQMIPRRRGPG